MSIIFNLWREREKGGEGTSTMEIVQERRKNEKGNLHLLQVHQRQPNNQHLDLEFHEESYPRSFVKV